MGRSSASAIVRAVLLGTAILCSLSSCGSFTNSKIGFFEEAMRSADDTVAYVFRESYALGYVVPFTVRVDNKVIGDLKQGAYMAIHVTPGFHSLRVSADGFLSVSLEGVKSSASGTKSNRSYQGYEMSMGSTLTETPDGWKLNDSIYYAAPNKTYHLQSDGGEVKIRDSYTGSGFDRREGIQVEFNAKPNDPLYIRCRGGEAAFLTKGEAMKSLSAMKYDMPLREK
jgi:hypothetical protein